jgi:hypothetical protein
MKRIIITVAALAVLFAAPSVNANVYTLSDLNSVFQVDTQAGAVNWVVDGVDQLFVQDFWVGTSAQGREYALGDYFTDGAMFPNDPIVILHYNENPLYDVQIIYALTGGSAGSGMSDVAETIRITANRAFDMRFFQHCDFDLGGTAGDDLIYFPNANAVVQQDGGGSAMVSETVVTPVATHHEGNNYFATNSIHSRLNDDLPTTLTDLPAVGGGSVFGDVEWAFQWNERMSTGETYIISKDKHLSSIPEPSTLLLIGVGLLGAEVARRRRKKA